MKTLDDFFRERQAQCSASLRMVGADGGDGLVLMRLLWATEYWKQRAENAESMLAKIENNERQRTRDPEFSLERWFEAKQSRAEQRKKRHD